MRFSLKTLLLLMTVLCSFLSGYQFCRYRIERPHKVGSPGGLFTERAKVYDAYGWQPEVSYYDPRLPTKFE